MQKGFVSVPLLIIIVALILGSYWAGIKYSENKIKLSNESLNTESQPTPTKKVESKEDLIRRCGDIPDKAYPDYGNFDVRKGPLWSPDCRFIAWSMWESGTSYGGNDLEVIKQIENNPKTLSGREGVFLYKDADKSVMKIYNPKELNETSEFIEWVDSQNLIFKAKSKEYNYNITTKEITTVD